MSNPYNPYLYDKLVQAHSHELLHEADKQRMLEQLPQRHAHPMLNIVRRFAAFRISLPFFPKMVVRSPKKVTGQL